MAPAPQPEHHGLDSLLERTGDRPSARECARILGQLPLFSRVGKRQLRKLAELAEYEEFTPGDMVFQAGDQGDAFYLILSGRAKVVGRGRALRRGDYFGEMALLDGEPRSATITAAGELQTMKLPRRRFAKLLEQEPTIATALLTELAARVRRLEKSAAA